MIQHGFSPRRQASSHKEACLPQWATPCGVQRHLSQARNRPPVVWSFVSNSPQQHRKLLVSGKARCPDSGRSEIRCHGSEGQTRPAHAPRW